MTSEAIEGGMLCISKEMLCNGTVDFNIQENKGRIFLRKPEKYSVD